MTTDTPSDSPARQDVVPRTAVATERLRQWFIDKRLPGPLAVFEKALREAASAECEAWLAEGYHRVKAATQPEPAIPPPLDVLRDLERSAGVIAEGESYARLLRWIGSRRAALPPLDVEHISHRGKHTDYSCGFSGPHCWGCGEPWPCRASRAAYRQAEDARAYCQQPDTSAIPNPERCHCGHLNASCDLPDRQQPDTGPTPSSRNAEGASSGDGGGAG